MARAYKSSSGRIIPRRSGGQFRRTTLQDFGISQSELSDGNMICANCGYGEGEEKWRPVLKTGYCPKCHSQEKKVCPTPRAVDGGQAGENNGQVALPTATNA